MSRANVPCNGCKLCCTNDMIFLHPDEGDRPSDYLTQPVFNPLTGKAGLMLQKKPNGDCVYLGETGCMIHGRAPVICRTFDCRRLYLKFSTAERKRMIRAGVAGQAVFDAGRKRLRSLEGA